MTQEKNALAWNSLLYHMSQPNNFSNRVTHMWERQNKMTGGSCHTFDAVWRPSDSFRGIVVWNSVVFIVKLGAEMSFIVATIIMEGHGVVSTTILELVCMLLVRNMGHSIYVGASGKNTPSYTSMGNCHVSLVHMLIFVFLLSHHHQCVLHKT